MKGPRKAQAAAGLPQVGASHQAQRVSEPKQSCCQMGDHGIGADARAAGTAAPGITSRSRQILLSLDEEEGEYQVELEGVDDSCN